MKALQTSFPKGNDLRFSILETNPEQKALPSARGFPQGFCKLLRSRALLFVHWFKRTLQLPGREENYSLLWMHFAESLDICKARLIRARYRTKRNSLRRIPLRSLGVQRKRVVHHDAFAAERNTEACLGKEYSPALLACAYFPHKCPSLFSRDSDLA